MKRCFLFCVVLSQLFSCSKSENSPVSPPSNNNPRLVKEYFILDTTKLAPEDTLVRFLLEYDQLDRCIKNTMSGPAIQGVYTPTGIHRITYSGNSKVATYIESNKYGYNSTRMKHYYIYDSQDRLISDSVVSITMNGANYDSVVYSEKYSYPNNLGFNKRYFAYYPYLWTVYPNAIFTNVEQDINGNIATVRHENASFSHTFEYDSYENPLTKIFPANYPTNLDDGGFNFHITQGAYFEQKKPLKRIFYNRHDASGNIISSTLFKEFKNTYTAAGLIESSQPRTFPADPHDDKLKIFFKY